MKAHGEIADPDAYDQMIIYGRIWKPKACNVYIPKGM